MQWRLESELQKIGIEGMEIFSHNVDDDIAKLGIKRIHKKLHTMLKKRTRIIDKDNNKFIQSHAMDINTTNNAMDINTKNTKFLLMGRTICMVMPPNHNPYRN